MQETDTLTMFISSRESTCDERGVVFGRKAWISLDEKKKAFRLSCADLDHLVFLPSGDTAVTRQARKHSTLWVVVLRWSLSRKRYDQCGNPKLNGWRLNVIEVL